MSGVLVETMSRLREQVFSTIAHVGGLGAPHREIVQAIEHVERALDGLRALRDALIEARDRSATRTSCTCPACRP